jgi:hypothetical protein
MALNHPNKTNDLMTNDPMTTPKKYILKPGKHQFAPGSHATHHNDNLTDAEAQWYLQRYPHIATLFENIPPPKIESVESLIESVKSTKKSVESPEIQSVKSQHKSVKSQPHEDLPATN